MVTALGSPDLWDQDGGYLHILGWKSAIIHRTCRSTFRAETQGMTYGTEAGVHIRAALSQMKGKFNRKDWENSCAQTMKHVWFTDCQSLYDYLINPITAGSADKRLEIDLENLREDLWFNTDGTLKDQITDDQNSKPRWIDTSTMICDPLTKAGNEVFKSRLVKTMSTGYFDLEPTPESLLKKMSQQKYRLGKALQKSASK